MAVEGVEGREAFTLMCPTLQPESAFNSFFSVFFHPPLERHCLASCKCSLAGTKLISKSVECRDDDEIFFCFV